MTDRDLVVRAMADGGTAGERTAASACSDDLVTVAPDDDLDRLAALTRGAGGRRIPAVDGGRPVGIVCLGDLTVAGDSGSAPGTSAPPGPSDP